MKSITLAMLTILTCLCPRPSAHAQLLKRPYVGDKQTIVRAVLEAELRRQGEVFEEVTQLSSENIGLIPSLEISGRKIVVLDATRLREQVRDGNSITYLLFKSFEAEGGNDVVVVRLSRVTEQDRCFGGYHKESRDHTYAARKVGDGWRAELRGRSLPLFGSGASVKSF